ncbi:MAG: HAD-IB family hydrolase [Anaerolineae bacterium]|nr:HAD-IB family hydrolase [Anaerolineae bacterium]
MRAAFFDVDGTLTKVRIWEGIMAYYRVHGGKRLTRILFLAYHIPLILLYKIGLIPQIGMRRPWGGHLAWFFRGKSAEEVEEISEWIVDDFLEGQWQEDSLKLVEKHLREGDEVVLVSASPGPLLRRIAHKLGVEHVVGTEPAVRNGFYTGGVAGEICIGENKAHMARGYFLERDMAPDLGASFAYADSPGDMDLLEMVGNPTATHPDDDLRPLAEEKGWPIFPG